jgi:two-component system sensor histidine kinase SenX3
MVEQVLELAGAQSGKTAYEPRPVSIDSVITDAVAAVRHLLDEKNFVVETSIASDLPHVIADPEALSRSIQNLIQNAIKYAADGRWIGITAKPGGNGARPEVLVTVEDRGMGISAADLPNIFRPFYRAREVVDAQIHGSGLGLSLVKSAVEAAGGRVRVESSPGRGTSFVLHLPAEPKLAQTL